MASITTLPVEVLDLVMKELPLKDLKQFVFNYTIPLYLIYRLIPPPFALPQSLCCLQEMARGRVWIHRGYSITKN